MANTPIALIQFPDRKDRTQIIAAVTTSAGAAGGVVTLTIPAGYPPIDRTIPCPIIAILGAAAAAGLLANENLVWAIAGTMGSGAGGVPDSVGEFQVTGARTVDVWELTAGVKHILIVYVAKGSGQET
jgi:hypothetical protein